MAKKLKWYHRTLFVLGFLILAAVTIYIIATYKKIAAEVPTHFNSMGEADAYGSKDSLFVPLIIGWALYAVTTIIGGEVIPAEWNTGVAVTEKNHDIVYSILRTMTSLIAFAMATLFSSIVFYASQGKSLPFFVLPIFLILVFGSIIISVVRLVRNL